MYDYFEVYTESAKFPCYSLLCFCYRLADIPCVIINGMTKSALYEIGCEVNREQMASQWNAVFLEGQWRLVDCFWASVCVDERNATDKIDLTKKGSLKRVSVEDEGPVPFNDFYFLVDPNHLLWTHLADDPDWQLMQKPITEREFQERVYIREQFHLLEMEIENKCENCILQTDGDPVDIVFKLPKTKGRFYKFAYTLTQSKTDVSDNGGEKPVDVLLERFVYFEHTEGKIQFTIQLPITGMFQFDIFAVNVKKSNSYKLLCTYLIQCDGKHENVLPFPDCPDLGWGVTPHAEDAGICLRSKQNSGGQIFTTTGEIELIFEVQEIAYLSSSLKNILINEALLSKYIISRRDKDKYIVKVRLPREGQYALKIFADDEGKIESYIPKDVINILLYFEGGEKINEPFPNVAGGDLGTKPYAEKFGIDVLSYQNGMVKAWGGRARVEFETHSDGVFLMCDLSTTNKDAQARSKVETTHVENHWVFDLTLPVPGDYSMNVLATLEEDSGNVFEVQSYMITSIVSDVKRVKFADDTNEEDDIITATIRTSEESITIPIPLKDSGEKVFTRISKKDARDGENGMRPSVTVNRETFDITLKEDGEYVMDVWARDSSNVLETVARFAICRRPSIESYTDDIEALIESLKPQEETEEVTEENTERVEDDEERQSTIYEEDEEEAQEEEEVQEEEDTENSVHSENTEKEDREEKENHNDEKDDSSYADEANDDTEDEKRPATTEESKVIVIGAVNTSNENNKRIKPNSQPITNDESDKDTKSPESHTETANNETARSSSSVSKSPENIAAAAVATSTVVEAKEKRKNESLSTTSDDLEEKVSDEVFSTSDGRSLMDTDNESIMTYQDNERIDSTRNDSVSVSAFGLVAAHVISEDKVEDDNDDEYSDEDEELTKESEKVVKFDEKNLDKNTQSKYLAGKFHFIF